MPEPLVSIIIPHYETESLARVCLRSIRRHTPDPTHEVIVVDNGSADGDSLAYLRRVQWITLIERTEGLDDRVSMVHKQALDIGIAAARGKYLLSFHTDTIVLRDDWLRWLVDRLEADDSIAAVGSYKLDMRSRARRVVQSIETTGRRLLGRTISDTTPFIRSHCALYRRDALERLGYRFTGDEETCGRTIHFDLIDAGYRALLLDSGAMNRRLVHLEHGTMVLHPKLGARPRVISKGRSRIERFMDRAAVREVLEDDELDRGPMPFASET